MKIVALFFLLAMSFSKIRAGEVDTVEVFSASMNRYIKTVVLTPWSYSPSEKPYPVVFLLHGWSGNYSSWIFEAPQLVDWVDEKNAIVVCPDGGYDSWWLDSPVDSTVRFETFLSKELVAWIDHYYHTQKAATGRAITGLSMGGHGALYNAFRNPTVFGACGSMAGGLDLRPWRKNGWDLQAILGDPRDHWENWENASVINWAATLKPDSLQLLIDCGADDFFIEMNRATHAELTRLDIPHEYTERPGEHNSEYWSSAIDFQLLFFEKFFNRK